MINEGKSHEIIIIKRGNEEEEAHHGGAWKIAFADFMTAMMALFLVLWLINAANEETKRAVASYFNPVKLVDRNRSSKGVSDQKGGPSSETEEGTSEPDSKPSTDQSTTNTLPAKASQGTGKADDNSPEAAFFAAPLAAIDTIRNVGIVSHEDLGAPSKENKATSGGDFADPFMPDFSDKNKDQVVSEGTASESVSVMAGNTAKDAESELSEHNEAGTISPEKGQEGHKLQKEAAADEMKAAIYDALRNETENAQQLEASIDVKVTDMGLLISVSDTVQDPMFEIGSAIPAPAMVLAVEAISKTLLARKGGIHIFGHTDARQFQGEGDGNWRLSTQRAKATYFILLHGGLPDSRVQEISGRADRQLFNVTDPLSGENRRIEILLGAS